MAEQEQSSKQAALEAELRRSIEASMAERVKEEKLKLSKKALELGKQKASPSFCCLNTRNLHWEDASWTTAPLDWRQCCVQTVMQPAFAA